MSGPRGDRATQGAKAPSRGRILVIYHFFYPDDVVSSRHLSDFASGLAKRGWEVTALTSDRVCRSPKERIEPRDESWHGVTIHRAFRPALRQSTNAGRLLNTFWLAVGWLWFIARQPPFDVVVLGSDPQFGYLMLPVMRLLRRRSALVYWAFDLYPEAIVANEMGVLSRLVSAVRPLTRFCYARLDGMVDIGPCMRRRLDEYGHDAAHATLVPWALAEPKAPLAKDPDTRRELFGNANLGLLYSGTIGNAHEFESFIALARELRRRNASISLCFAGRGNRYDEVRAMVKESDTNIRFAAFADESRLEERLGSGDIHMISLRPGWQGVVVPSKFFGSLAAGRPLLYAGSPHSSIKSWIDEHEVGLFLQPDNITQVADEMCRLAADPGLLAEKQRNAFRCYQENFSREKVMAGWDEFLGRMVNSKQPRAPSASLGA